MSENYDLISENDMHMPIRCIMQRFDHIRSQMHDYFELSIKSLFAPSVRPDIGNW